MHLHHFLGISLEDQADFIRYKGRFLATRKAGDKDIILYHTGSFFAEVWYDYSKEQLLMIRGFEDCRPLEPYLENIDLPVLFHN